MSDNKTQQWYTIKDEALEELGHIQEIASNLEDLINVGIEELFDLVTTQHRASGWILNLIRLYELLAQLGLDDYPYDYYVERLHFIGKWSTPTANYKMEDGEMLITMANLSGTELAQLSDTIKDLEESGTIKLLDEDDGIREIINEAFNRTPLYPENVWDEDKEMVRELPKWLKDKIWATQEKVFIDPDFDQFKEVRKMILSYLEII